MAAFGVHVGGYAHVLAASFGLSAIFVHVPLAYMAVKFAGAAYLVWLGIDLIRKRNQPLDIPKAAGRRRGSAFLQSVSVEILNPKAAIFFIAFLPQFVDPAAGAPLWLQLLVLGTIVNVAFSSADVISVFLTSKILSHINVTQAGARIARTIGGTILMGLGVAARVRSELAMQLDILSTLNAERAARRAVLVVTETDNGRQRLVKGEDAARDPLKDLLLKHSPAAKAAWRRRRRARCSSPCMCRRRGW